MHRPIIENQQSKLKAILQDKKYQNKSIPSDLKNEGKLFYKELIEEKKSEAANSLCLKLADLKIQYKDFALWQRSYLSEERLNNQISYWKDKLNGYEPLNLISVVPHSILIN